MEDSSSSSSTEAGNPFCTMRPRQKSQTSPLVIILFARQVLCATLQEVQLCVPEQKQAFEHTTFIFVPVFVQMVGWLVQQSSHKKWSEMNPVHPSDVSRFHSLRCVFFCSYCCCYCCCCCCCCCFTRILSQNSIARGPKDMSQEDRVQKKMQTVIGLGT